MLDRTISVVGLGYVGLPVAVGFARSGRSVVCYDHDPRRIAELERGLDRTRAFGADALKLTELRFTSSPEALAAASCHIVTVPTPIDAANTPDLSALRSASETVARYLKPGDLVVYESTVYPGATEEVCIPLLERTSGLALGRDFAVGYSPERINPGDTEHTFETITKVVSASDATALDRVEALYENVVKAGIFRAPSIKVAEAAKAIENTQRDLNIALINELAVLFKELGIDTRDVLTAAGTKWNFLKFTPGLVGGHCIGIDPYYLTYKAQMAGYDAQIILAGRRLNEGMSRFVARHVIRGCAQNGIAVPPRVTVLGITFKENIADVRNSKVADLINELHDFGAQVQLHDPQCHPREVLEEYGFAALPFEALEPADAVVLAVGHRSFREAGWRLIERCLKPRAKAFVADVPGALDRATRPERIVLWRL